MMNAHVNAALVLGSTLAVAAIAGCGRSETSSSSEVEPAHVAHHVDEAKLNTLTLTEQAEKRLGIVLAEVALEAVERKAVVGGEVILPPGRTLSVSAPVAGTLLAPADSAVPAPGERVAAGQPVFSFRPLLTPERDVLTPAERVRVAQTRADVATAQVEAERQVESAKVRVQAATIAYDRAVQLLRTKAGSQRSVDLAEADLKLAREAQRTAEARYRLLSGINLEEQAGELASRAITSPVSGTLQRLDTAAGETVSAGAPLFSVIATETVWIRVPVYVGQWREIDTEREALISELGSPSRTTPRPARVVSAPPSADANAATVDVFYALDNQEQQLQPGQKLLVTLPLHGPREGLVVPFNAIVYDIHGGAWVYAELDHHVYARRRVSVDYVSRGNAILAAGPEPGTKVVTAGAAELFGTEFGVGH